MSEIRIRKAELSDLDQVTQLFDLYRQFYKKPEEKQKARDFLRQRMEKAESVILVAEDDAGKLCGFTQLYPSFSSIGLSQIWILNDLYVDAAYRRNKIGRQLVLMAHEFASQTGASSIQLETAKDNVTAQGLYESLGYQRDEKYFTYSLSLRR